MDRLKEVLSMLALPLFALAALAAFYIVWVVLDLPPRDEVVRIAEIYFERYGLITILIAAIIEATLFAGWYFPGSLVIVIGVVIAGRDIPQLLGVFGMTTIGFIVALSFNYYVGKYGWYTLLTALGFQESLRKAQSQLTQYGPRAVFFTYFHPNLAALTATAAGILQMPFRDFTMYSIVAITLWNIFWTIVGYTFGETSIDLIGPKFVVPFIAAWIVLILFRKYRSQNLISKA